MAFQHNPGDPIECLSIPIYMEKEEIWDPKTQRKYYYSGFSIGGGINQDYRQSPHNFPDYGIYVTSIKNDSPAQRSGLRYGDKILSCNGRDFTMCTHEQAVDFISSKRVLNFLVARQGVTSFM